MVAEAWAQIIEIHKWVMDIGHTAWPSGLIAIPLGHQACTSRGFVYGLAQPQWGRGEITPWLFFPKGGPGGWRQGIEPGSSTRFVATIKEMNMKQKLAIAAALFCAQSFSVQADSNVSEGKELFSQFRCAECHGADAKKPVGKYGSVLAGMNTDDIFLKTKKFIESKSHEQVLQGCGEPPSHVQIKKMSDYLSTLPK
jgi:cytochrome c553